MTKRKAKVADTIVIVKSRDYRYKAGDKFYVRRVQDNKTLRPGDVYAVPDGELNKPLLLILKDEYEVLT
ncbi:hypothetical protein ACFSGI_08800 [Paenibacillus nicotianae]|uniref:Uncharacterized protein n=1 Tax=Paenibacillus nicotianae TaxID=1526551 RepID=A0ABW4UUD5_9BACL